MSLAEFFSFFNLDSLGRFLDIFSQILDIINLILDSFLMNPDRLMNTAKSGQFGYFSRQFSSDSGHHKPYSGQFFDESGQAYEYSKIWTVWVLF